MNKNKKDLVLAVYFGGYLDKAASFFLCRRASSLKGTPYRYWPCVSLQGTDMNELRKVLALGKRFDVTFSYADKCPSWQLSLQGFKPFFALAEAIPPDLFLIKRQRYTKLLAFAESRQKTIAIEGMSSPYTEGEQALIEELRHGEKKLTMESAYYLGLN